MAVIMTAATRSCSALMAEGKTSVLFLCTGNSARSLMAEAIANHQFGDRLEVRSAGSHPKGEPHPLTLATLQKNGVSTEGLRSTSWNELKDRKFYLVITLCDAARNEACPAFPGEPRRAHWSLPDPAAADHPQDMFDAVYDALVEAIGLLVYGPQPDLGGRLSEIARQIVRRFTPRAI